MVFCFAFRLVICISGFLSLWVSRIQVKEYGITDRHIIGVLKAVVRDGREIPVTDRKYRFYVHLWCDLFPIRALILKVKRLPGRIKKKGK